jgi:hypothetical protein
LRVVLKEGRFGLVLLLVAFARDSARRRRRCRSGTPLLAERIGLADQASELGQRIGPMRIPALIVASGR